MSNPLGIGRHGLYIGGWYGKGVGMWGVPINCFNTVKPSAIEFPTFSIFEVSFCMISLYSLSNLSI